jgi:hypothetical protein
VREINIYGVLPEEFFKPLTSKYKDSYVDCIGIIYDTYKAELSFGVDKEVVMYELENYFDSFSSSDMVFDEEEEIASDSKAKAGGVLRRLKECGWIEYEVSNDYMVKVNLFDYSVTMIESFNKIVRNEELEYQSVLSQIHATLQNEESYVKPYGYIIKRVLENTEELIVGLKKLNSNIKKYIEDIVAEKTPKQILEDLFLYQKEIGSKAYHRIKTSDNISHFRNPIIDKLYKILNDELIFNLAREILKAKILSMISTLRNLDEIIKEIEDKHSKYINSAIARAKFLLNNSNNEEGKTTQILSYIADEFNRDENLNLYDDVEDSMFELFNIFPQNFIDNDSLYVIPIKKMMYAPDEFSGELGITQESRNIRKQALREKQKNRFSRKNISEYVDKVLDGKRSVLASTLPLETKRDLIRIIFISLYGNHRKSNYKVVKKDEIIRVNDFKYNDFEIERCK